jgi:hypothetical protein
MLRANELVPARDQLRVDGVTAIGKGINARGRPRVAGTTNVRSDTSKMFQAALLWGRALQALQTDSQRPIGRCVYDVAQCLIRHRELEGEDLRLRPKPRFGDVESAPG